ncbi:MAG: caspase family protein, partial [Treponema sp.]|nr:caspase family protein [Treponema sp.]
QSGAAAPKKGRGVKIALCAGILILAAAAAVFTATGAGKQAPPPEAPAEAAPRPAEGAPLAGITALAAGPGGEYLAGAYASGLLRIWDVRAGKQLQVWKAGGNLRAAAFSPDAEEIAAASGRKVTVWNRRARTELFTLEAPAAVVSLEYAPEGPLCGLLETGEVVFWNAADGKPAGSGAAGFSGQAVLGGGRVFRAEGGAAVLADAGTGREIRRYAFAGASALALQPGGDTAAAAGGGTLSVWDSAGTAASFPQAAGNITCLALSAGGTEVFCGGEDGLIVMLRAATGEETARFAGFGESEENAEWICLTAAGYYTGSKKGAELFTVTAGEETFTLDRFREALHRSDLVAKALRGGKEEAARPESAGKPAAKDGVTLAALLKEADRIPLIEITGPARRTSGKAAETIQVRITDRGQGAGKIMIYNGGLCAGLPGLEEVMTARREVNGATVYDASLTIDLKPGVNPIAVTVFGGREHGAPESKKARVEITTDWKPPVPAESRPVLHVFTAAIQNYARAGEDLNKLRYTRADAEALRTALAQQGTTGTRYAKVETYTLYDAEVTREGLSRKFDEIKPLVHERDSFVFFFSGHGDVDDYKDFYFLPADAEGWSAGAGKNILKQDLLGNLLKIPARNIFVMLDTCRSGALEDTTSAIDRAWGDLAQKANLAILMAAAGNQYAIESPDDGQGVLTWTALKSLEGGARTSGGRYVGVSGLLSHVRREAPRKAEEVVAKAVQRALRGGQEALPAEVATRGVFDAAGLAQEPVTREPERDFDLADLKWRPAKVTVSALSAGELTVEGEGPEQTFGMAAKKPVTLTLREGEYTFTMRYRAALEPETRKETIENGKAGTIAFTARVPGPGILSVRSLTAGSLTIEGLPGGSAPVSAGAPLTKRLPGGTYRVTVTYGDGHTETRSAEVQNEKTLTLAFDYRPAPPASTVQPQSAVKVYSIGERGPAGGWIFYDKGSYTNGWRYLEAAPRDAGEKAEWGLWTKTVGGTQTAVGSGKKNTQIILQALRQTGETGTAAQLCDAFEAGGFADWFLPSVDELDLMYTNLKKNGLGNFSTDTPFCWYRSSSEYGNYFAWNQRFSDGNQDYINKTFTFSVRAVRAF